jgi:hypothetical protein
VYKAFKFGPATEHGVAQVGLDTLKYKFKAQAVAAVDTEKVAQQVGMPNFS